MNIVPRLRAIGRHAFVCFDELPPKNCMRIAVITLPLLVSVVGCATSTRPQTTSTTSADWKKGNFQVHFQAGPRGENERSYSYYEISYRITDQQERYLVMESAHSIHGFKCEKNGDPQNWIRIVEDPSGKALLIEEEIPNECGPCSNYLWVRLNSGGALEGTYLQLPSRSTGSPGGIDYEYPQVRSLDGDVLKFRYSQGRPVSKNIAELEKSDKPTPPG